MSEQTQRNSDTTSVVSVIQSVGCGGTRHRALRISALVIMCAVAAGLPVGCASDDDDAADTSSSDVADNDADTEVLEDTDTDTTDDDATDDDATDDATDDGDVSEVDWAACAQGELCMLREPGCCASCTELSIDEVEAVSILSRSEFLEATCDEQVPICDGCVSSIDPHLVAACESQRCVAYDMRTSDFSTCDTDADCRVRYADCCECGPAVIALATSADARYQSAVCDRLDCPDCRPEAPTETAACVAGHCQLIP